MDQQATYFAGRRPSNEFRFCLTIPIYLWCFTGTILPFMAFSEVLTTCYWYILRHPPVCGVFRGSRLFVVYSEALTCLRRILRSYTHLSVVYPKVPPVCGVFRGPCLSVVYPEVLICLLPVVYSEVLACLWCSLRS